MNQPDDITGIIVDAAKKVLQAIEQRCNEALKTLDQQDHLVAMGAIVGLEDQVRQVAARLMVLREVKEMQKQK